MKKIIIRLISNILLVFLCIGIILYPLSIYYSNSNKNAYIMGICVAVIILFIVEILLEKIDRIISLLL